MQNKRLIGNSGCRVELHHSKSNKTFVCKKSSDIAYNQRLQVQIDKQIDFKARGYLVPTIFEVGTDYEGLLFFNMEYIPGLKLSQVAENSISEKILADLNAILKRLAGEDLIAEPIHPVRKKLAELEIQLPSESHFKRCIEFLQIFQWEKVKRTKCHGDFTLENIIVNSKGIYLIDFQDVTTNSYLQDVSKILFDLEFHWSSRYRIESISKVNTFGNYRKILNMIDFSLGRFEDRQTLEALKLLNILRIYPYLRDTESASVASNALIEISSRLGIK